MCIGMHVRFYQWQVIANTQSRELEHSNLCTGIPELPGIIRNYPELGGTGSS